MDRLNLDVEKYSISELKDIFDISEVNDIQAIKLKLDTMELSISEDLNLDIPQKTKIINFLKNAHDKMCGEFSNEISDKNKNSSLFTASRTNMINDAPQNHPLILSANRVGGKSAKIFEGRGGENFPAGYLNPINIRTTSHMMNIDSIFRPNYFLTNSSQFSFDLPQTIKGVVQMNIASIQIPLTLHSINNSNNYFEILVTEVASDKVKSIKVSIQVGNYLTFFTTNDLQISKTIEGDPGGDSEGDRLEQTMNNAISNALASQLFASNDDFFTSKPDNLEINFAYNFNTAQSIFQLSDTLDEKFKIQIKFIDESNPQGMIGQLGWLLGFRKAIYEFNGYHKIYSEASVSVQQPKYLYLCINDFTNASSNQFVVQFEDSTLAPNIIMRLEYQTFIQENGMFNYGTHPEVVHGKREYFGPVDIKKLQFTIIDEFGRIVDFNNRDWNVQLEFTRMYE
jgi:hypothetical protein